MRVLGYLRRPVTMTMDARRSGGRETLVDPGGLPAAPCAGRLPRGAREDALSRHDDRSGGQPDPHRPRPGYLGKLGIHAPVHFKGEFGVDLLMGPHDRTGYKQIVESIGANSQRVSVVAFEQAPADGGEPSPKYRTYTLWIVPNRVYRRGVRVEVVTPSDEPIATNYLP